MSILLGATGLVMFFVAGLALFVVGSMLTPASGAILGLLFGCWVRWMHAGLQQDRAAALRQRMMNAPKAQEERIPTSLDDPGELV